MKKILEIIKWGMLLAVVVTVLFFTDNKQEEQIVQFGQIEIDNLDDKFLNEDIILKYIAEHNFIYDGVLLSKFQFNNLEVILFKHPAVKSVKVYSNQLGIINIKLQQRKAIVRIKTSDTDYYLDEDGLEMSLSNAYTSSVVVVTGDVNHNHHNMIKDFIKEINKSEFWNSQVVQLHFLVDQVVLVPRVGGQKIHFGKLVNVTEKLANLYQFYKQAMPVKGWQRYSDISLKFKNQIVCTKK